MVDVGYEKTEKKCPLGSRFGMITSSFSPQSVDQRKSKANPELSWGETDLTSLGGVCILRRLRMEGLL